MKKTKKINTSDVRKALFDTMTGVLMGKIDVKKAHVAVKAASGINQSIRFDLEKERLALKAKKASVKITGIEI